MQRFGHVAVLGAPNVGKSSLVNLWIGQKVSIVSSKAQTTRTRILGIALQGEAQIVLLDTPGIFSAQEALGRAMVRAAWSSLEEADLACIVVDASSRHMERSLALIDRLKATSIPLILILNKIDRVQKHTLLAQAQMFYAKHPFEAVFMVSAQTGEGVSSVLEYFAQHVPESAWRYPEEQISTLPQRFLAEELTREKIFQTLHKELPYALHVQTERWQQQGTTLKIHQVIYVQRKGQKLIVVGKNGSRIKEIGTAARVELEHLLGMRVHLFLHVKVDPQWQDKKQTYADLHLEDG